MPHRTPIHVVIGAPIELEQVKICLLHVHAETTSFLVAVVTFKHPQKPRSEETFRDLEHVYF